MSDQSVWESSRPKAGRRFEPTHELALHEQAVDVSRQLVGAVRGLVLVRELAGPIGIPDLTALVGASDRLDERLALDVPPLTHEVDAAVVSAAKHGSARSAATLARSLGWPESTVARRIPSLVRSGALLGRSRGTFTRPEALVPVGRIVAIEAKLKDWHGALAQARAYSTWADNYVIVMGALAPRVVEALRMEVRADNGGLVVDGKWLVRPRRRPLPLPKKMWASEHFVAALVGIHHHPSRPA